MINAIIMLLLTLMVVCANLLAETAKETGDSVMTITSNIWFAVLALIAYLELRKL